ncbi:MAG: amidohydrolase family protein [Anaerolineales bacterium]|nr:amidohydrolase family protein [Anaerolineales bacterium]
MIDIHTHPIGLTNQQEYDFFIENGEIRPGALDLFMNAISDVDRAVALAVWAPKADIRVSNEFIAAVVSYAPKKLVGFASVDPNDPRAITLLDRAIFDLNLKGIKFAPIYQDFAPDYERYWPLYKRIQQLGIPIMWHQGASFMAPQGPFEYAYPSRLDRMIRDFSDIPMVIAHFGYPWSREVVALIRKHALLYTDVSVLAKRPWFLYNALVDAMEYGVLDKVFLGSDYPAFTARETVKTLRGLADMTRNTGLPSIDTESIEQIIHRDSLSVLGIKE